MLSATYNKRATMAAMIVLFLGALLLIVTFTNRPFQSRGKTVADAEADLKRSQAKLERSLRVVNKTEKLAQGMGSTTSPVNQAIHLVGQSMVQRFEKENILAHFELESTRKSVAADFSVKIYSDFNQAQKALATVYLSGISEVRLLPTSLHSTTGRLPGLSLMVPKDLAVKAAHSLRVPQSHELMRSSDIMFGFRAAQKLKETGIQTVIRPFRPLGQTEPSPQVQVLFIRSIDKEAALKILGDSSTEIGDGY